MKIIDTELRTSNWNIESVFSKDASDCCDGKIEKIFVALCMVLRWEMVVGMYTQNDKLILDKFKSIWAWNYMILLVGSDGHCLEMCLTWFTHCKHLVTNYFHKSSQIRMTTTITGKYYPLPNCNWNDHGKKCDMEYQYSDSIRNSGKYFLSSSLLTTKYYKHILWTKLEKQHFISCGLFFNANKNYLLEHDWIC